MAAIIVIWLTLSFVLLNRGGTRQVQYNLLQTDESKNAGLDFESHEGDAMDLMFTAMAPNISLFASK